MGPGDLHDALSGLPLVRHPDLLAGMERAEDAGVYRLNEGMAIIQTVDFFTPIVDDPFVFGQIATVNALSDVYAMGGRPLTAMNIVCFPVKSLEISVLRDILQGGLDKMREAGVVLIGGHSIEDPELKYGLSVTGLIHPEKVVHNHGARPGDRLILTKPLGTGIISTALKRKVAPPDTVAAATRSMTTLNRSASEVMQEVGVNACTDITGFGLLGHASAMVEDTGVGLVIQAKAVPVFPGTEGLAEAGLAPGGLQRNRDFRQGMVDIDPGVPAWLSDVLYDPQTSGGLFMAVPAPKASLLLRRLREEGIDADDIGEVVAEPKGRITVS